MFSLELNQTTLSSYMTLSAKTFEHANKKVDGVDSRFDSLRVNITELKMCL